MSISYLFLNRTSHQISFSSNNTAKNFEVNDISPKPESTLLPIDCYTFYDEAFSHIDLSILPRRVRILSASRDFFKSENKQLNEDLPIEGTSLTLRLSFSYLLKSEIKHLLLSEDKVSVSFSYLSSSQTPLSLTQALPPLRARLVTIEQFEKGQTNSIKSNSITTNPSKPHFFEKKKFSPQLAKKIAEEKNVDKLLDTTFSFVFVVDEYPPDSRIDDLFSQSNIQLKKCEIHKVTYKPVIAGQKATLNYTFIVGKTQDEERRVISFSNNNQSSQEHLDSFFAKKNTTTSWRTNIENLKDNQGGLVKATGSYPLSGKLNHYIQKRLADFPTFNTDQHATQIIHLLAVEKHERWAHSKSPPSQQTQTQSLPLHVVAAVPSPILPNLTSPYSPLAASPSPAPAATTLTSAASPSPAPAATTLTSAASPSPAPAATTLTSAASPSPVPAATTLTSAASPSPVPAATTLTSAASPSPVPAATTLTSAASPSPAPAATTLTSAASPSPTPAATTLTSAASPSPTPAATTLTSAASPSPTPAATTLSLTTTSVTTVTTQPHSQSSYTSKKAKRKQGSKK